MGDYAEGKDGKEYWCVPASMVDVPEETWAFRNHIFVGSTGDGGLADWVKDVGGTKMKCWNEREGEGEGDWVPPEPLSAEKRAGEGERKDEKLHAHCHCGGVSFYISRPQSPSLFDSIDPTLVPEDKSKWFALHDVCESCRLATGCAIASWMFPLPSHITLADGSPYTTEFGTVKVYKSSEGVTRTFCGTCGATVTYVCDDRPGMVDVAVGLLDTEYVKAEEWLEWRKRKVAWEKDAAWKGVSRGLQNGLIGNE